MLKHLYYHFNDVILMLTENMELLITMFLVATIACMMFYIADEY